MSVKLTERTKSALRSSRMDHVPIQEWTEVISPTVEGPFPIGPDDVPEEVLWSAFGNSETETSAWWVLRLLRGKSGWTSFTVDDVEAAYHANGPKGGQFSFNQLVRHGYGDRKKVGGGWVVLGANGRYRVTMDFIFRCFESATFTIIDAGKASRPDELTEKTKSVLLVSRKDHVLSEAWTQAVSPTVEGPFPIESGDVPDEWLWSAFNNSETEASASWVLRTCREKGGWAAFAREEVEAMYAKEFKDGFSFNRLVDHGYSYGVGERTKAGGGWVVLGADGRYRVTMSFIFRCFESAASTILKRRKDARDAARPTADSAGTSAAVEAAKA